MSLTGQTRLRIEKTYARTVGLASTIQEIEVVPSQAWDQGDADDGQLILWGKDGLIVTTSPVSFDLASALIDPCKGTAQTWTKVKEIYVMVNTLTAGNLKISGNFIETVVLGGTGPYKLVRPGGKWYESAPLSAGMPVSSGTADVITFESTSGNLDVDFLIAGVGTLA